MCFFQHIQRKIGYDYILFLDMNKVFKSKKLQNVELLFNLALIKINSFVQRLERCSSALYKSRRWFLIRRRSSFLSIPLSFFSFLPLSFFIKLRLFPTLFKYWSFLYFCLQSIGLSSVTYSPRGLQVFIFCFIFWSTSKIFTRRNSFAKLIYLIKRGTLFFLK